MHRKKTEKIGKETMRKVAQSRKSKTHSRQWKPRPI